MIWILLNNPFTVSLSVVPGYHFPSTQCIRIQNFSFMALHVGPGDGLFATQSSDIDSPYYGFHVALCVVCGCMVFAIYIKNLNLMSTNNMSLQ